MRIVQVSKAKNKKVLATGQKYKLYERLDPYSKKNEIILELYDIPEESGVTYRIVATKKGWIRLMKKLNQFLDLGLVQVGTKQ